MSKKLRILFRSATPTHQFDTPNGVLKLDTYGDFTVTIKAYADAVAAIDQKIQEQTDYNSREYQKYKNLYDAKAAGGWNAEKVSQHEANTRVREATAARVEKEKESLRNQKAALRQSYADVEWSWQIAGTGANAGTAGGNISVQPGLSTTGEKTFHFPELLEGGGLCWVEAFRPETDPASGAIPDGFYVQATGTAQIVRCEWTTPDFQPIQGPVAFGSEVLLHIYTKGMFGHEINVGLMDRDLFSFNDLLNISDSDRFIAEVNVSEVKPFEIKKAGVDGLLTVADATSTGKPAEVQHIQKVTIPVWVDPKWESHANKGLLPSRISPELKVYCVIKELGTETEFKGFDRAYLAVAADGQLHDDPTVVYRNNPVVIDQIETNAGHFAPCKHTAVKISFPAPAGTGDDAPKPLYLFNEADTQRRHLRNYEMVSGYLRAAKTVTVELEGLMANPDVCRQPATKKHQGRTLQLVRWPEAQRGPAPAAGVQPTSSAPKKDRTTTTTTTSGNVSDGLVGIEVSGSTVSTAQKPVLEILEQTDAKLSFKVRYLYNMEPIRLGRMTVHPIFRYLWMGEQVAKAYEIAATTCRYSHRFQISVYPDVKWTLSLDYTNNKTRREVVGVDKHPEKAPPPPAGTDPNAKDKKWLSIGDKTLGISLKAKWDGEEALDLTADITESIRAKAEAADRIAKFIERVFLGGENKDDAQYKKPTAEQQSTFEQARRKFLEEHKTQTAMRSGRADISALQETLNRNPPGSDAYKQAAEALADRKRRLDGSQYTRRLKRNVVGFDFLRPNLSLRFSWSRVAAGDHQTEEKRNQTGILLEGQLEAKPIIGASCYLDFLALLQRSHPIALAVVAAADLTLALIGDGSKIIAELRATGSLNANLNGFLNTLTGENSFNKQDRAATKTDLAGVSGSFKFSLRLEVLVEARKNLLFVTVAGKFNLALQAEAAFSARATVDYDANGSFIKFYGQFEGLEITAKGEVSASLESNRKRGARIGGSINKEFKFQAIDKIDEKELYTFHLNQP